MAEQQQEASSTLAAVVVRFHRAGRAYHFLPGETSPQVGNLVVVETERGVDLGEVVGLRAELGPHEERPTRTVMRLAEQDDLQRKRCLQEKQQRAFRTCQGKIVQHGLPMKLIEAQYALDGRRLTFTFVSEVRVDFRALVRELAQTFRCRIELRQVGVRDQARMLGGMGPCGRPLCCASFLRDFASVGIRLAKTQGLSLNPTKISGYCDRLMCCLRFEQDQYTRMARSMPQVGDDLSCEQASGEVVGRNLLTGAVRVRTEGGTEVWVTEQQRAGEGSAAGAGEQGCPGPATCRGAGASEEDRAAPPASASSPGREESASAPARSKRRKRRCPAASSEESAAPSAAAPAATGEPSGQRRRGRKSRGRSRPGAAATRHQNPTDHPGPDRGTEPKHTE